MNCRYYPEKSGLHLFSIQIQRIPDSIPVRATDLQQNSGVLCTYFDTVGFFVNYIQIPLIDGGN